MRCIIHRGEEEVSSDSSGSRYVRVQSDIGSSVQGIHTIV
uniref:Uncharacterized protein n=1 Tax=viral metagenome TaxID=1070528 RepID=A0A6C0BLW1_9ZZZZ